MFIVQQKDLSQILHQLVGALDTRNILPILSSYLIETDKGNGIVKVTSTNSKTSAIAEVDAVVESDIKFAVLGKELTNIVTNLPNQDVCISINNEMVTVKCGASEFKLYTMDANRYPLFPEFNKDNMIKFADKDIKEMIKTSRIACGEMISKPLLSGVKWDFTDGVLTMVSMDGHRLSEVILNSKYETNIGFSCVVPLNSVNFIEKTLQDNGSVSICVNDNKMVLFYDKITIAAQLLGGKYPDYQGIMVDNNPIEKIIDRQDLIKAIKRVSILNNNDNVSLWLRFTKDTLSVFASNVELGEAQENIVVSSDENDVETIYNNKSLLQILNTIQSKSIRLSLAKVEENGYSSAQSFVYPMPEDERYKTRMLLMPLRMR